MSESNVYLQNPAKSFICLYPDGSHSYYGSLQEAIDNAKGYGVVIAKVLTLCIEVEEAASHEI